MKRRTMAEVLLCFLAGSTLVVACTSGEATRSNSAPVIRGPDGGWITECNGWADAGDYNICTWNCHNAANCGVDAGNDGIVACRGGNTGTIGGHSINWDTVPCAGDAGATCKGYCLSEPQQPGSAACCWEQPAGGAINITSGPGLACANQKCGVDGGAVAWDAGVVYETDTCADVSATKAACLQCCITRSQQVASKQAYLDACNPLCDVFDNCGGGACGGSGGTGGMTGVGGALGVGGVGGSGASMGAGLP